jgi:hypothetical protein
MFKMGAAGFFGTLVIMGLHGVTSQKIAILDFENDPEFAIHLIYYWLTGHRFLNLHNTTRIVDFDGIMWHFQRKQ